MNKNIKYLVESFIDDEDEIVDIDINFDSRLPYVDLGLPSGTKWAKCNLGAKSPEEPGLLYQWGMTDGYKFKTFNNKFKTVLGNKKYTGFPEIPKTASKYVYSPGDLMSIKDDAAYKKFGSNWRIPSEADFHELMLYTDQKSDKINDINGITFISKINGKTIFIPRAGFWRAWKYKYSGYNIYGCYWLSNIHDSDIYLASYINIAGEKCYLCSEERRAGLSIRPVYYSK